MKLNTKRSADIPKASRKANKTHHGCIRQTASVHMGENIPKVHYVPQIPLNTEGEE